MNNGLWRAMRESDLDRISYISDLVHRDYQEPRSVYAERLKLYPVGCISFEQDGVVNGFLVSHPWHPDASPALGAMLERLPDERISYYLHDIALLPETRGTGAGREATAYVINHARVMGFRDVTLVAVNGADSYWRTQGFSVVERAENGGPLPNYGEGTYFMRQML